MAVAGLTFGGRESGRYACPDTKAPLRPRVAPPVRPGLEAEVFHRLQVGFVRRILRRLVTLHADHAVPALLRPAGQAPLDRAADAVALELLRDPLGLVHRGEAAVHEVVL